MLTTTNTRRTPLACRWILFRKWSDFVRPTDQTRALCVRIPEVPRVVTDKDCRDCKLWEPADRRAS